MNLLDVLIFFTVALTPLDGCRGAAKFAESAMPRPCGSPGTSNEMSEGFRPARSWLVTCLNTNSRSTSVVHRNLNGSFVVWWFDRMKSTKYPTYRSKTETWNIMERQPLTLRQAASKCDPCEPLEKIVRERSLRFGWFNLISCGCSDSDHRVS